MGVGEEGTALPPASALPAPLAVSMAWRMGREAWGVLPPLSFLGPASGDWSLEQGMLGRLPPVHTLCFVFRLHL